MMDAVVNLEAMKKHVAMFSALEAERSSWFAHWREISDYFLPRRYPWLAGKKDNARTVNRRNRKLLDSTSTIAVRTLASGMMNGITSPARPWFSLRLKGFDEENTSHAASVWLEQVTKILLLILAESNFYNAMAVLFLEWCTFGTASLSIEEDYRDVIRCYNYPLGEFYISQDGAQRINRHMRRFSLTLEQIVDKFGQEGLTPTMKADYAEGGAKRLQTYEVVHIIERSPDNDTLLKVEAEWRGLYWLAANNEGQYLGVYPIYEWPTVTPRWELMGSDTYGTSPAMDALSDVQQLQSMLAERGAGLAKQVRPPLIVDQQLRNRPKALSAGGLTYAANNSTNFGAKPAYSVQLPFAELANDINQLRQSIRETCHNQLFNMISELDTVRSATEIDARREEKLVHLGPVLERFYNEGLDPALKRIFGIALRGGLLPEPPQELDEVEIDVQYVSVLSDAQRAVGTIAIERFFQFTGQLSGVYPEAREVPNVEELIRDYAEGIGIKPSGLRKREEVGERIAGQEQATGLAETAAIGKDLAQGAKVLSDTDVGGGANALQALMG